jgi:hypothetical protein
MLSVLHVRSNVEKSGPELNVVVECLPLLDNHDLLNCIDDVELHYVLSELARLDLGIVKQVLHDEGKYV